VPAHLSERLAHLEHRMAEFVVSVERTGRVTAANTGRLVPAWRRVFSPTDTLPFSRWSKLAMMLQSSISLSTGALVIARAVNILK
jgi:hypothetical protein